jgi:hypothetical protein
MNIGDKAKMLIGPKWHACTIEGIADIPHYSGQHIRMFTCRLKSGNVICCGRNSIRPAASAGERGKDAK